MAGTHKIPQNVTQYEGRIIGSFTAKQFIFLAIGAIAAFLLFNSPLPNLWKIIAIVVVLFISVLLSIVRVQGRTTDEWIAHFLRAVKYPTQRVWRKDEVPPAFLLPGYHLAHKGTKERTLARPELEKFIQLWKPINAAADLTPEEKTALERIRINTQPHPENQTPTSPDVTQPTPNVTLAPPAINTQNESGNTKPADNQTATDG